jgi:hypothetical protein
MKEQVPSPAGSGVCTRSGEEIFCTDGARSTARSCKTRPVVRRLIREEQHRHLLEIPYLAREQPGRTARAAGRVGSVRTLTVQYDPAPVADRRARRGTGARPASGAALSGSAAPRQDPCDDDSPARKLLASVPVKVALLVG